jgi:hypothetical protein
MNTAISISKGLPNSPIRANTMANACPTPAAARVARV